jgi:hypothetical protein
MQPTAPTIGTATAGDTTASVAFTASSYIGKGTITYTATSSPGGLTATGASSPLTVTGLTNGTAYTFTVVGNTNYGVASVASAASNSVTPVTAVIDGFTSIATANPGGTNTFTFSSIPNGYSMLQIRGVARSTYSAGYEYLYFRANSDTSSIYSRNSLVATATAAGNLRNGSLSFIPLANIPAANAIASNYGIVILNIVDYAKTNKWKTINGWVGFDNNNGGSTAEDKGSVGLTGGVYRSTNAINSITINTDNGNFDTYSQFALYGIK